MNKNYGVIIHPENIDDLLKMQPTECGQIIQNMLKTFKGEEIVKFDDRFLDYVSADLCGRVIRDKELSAKQRNNRLGKTKNNQTETKNNQTITKSYPNTNTNIKNIGFRTNSFVAGCTKSDIDFEELENKIVKNRSD